jgi:hypothetical protein
MDKQVIAKVTRVGTVIMALVVSFVTSPPVISVNSPVYWKNIFVFFSGAVSVIFFDKFKNKDNLKPLALILIGLLIVLVTCYEIMYTQFSVTCWDDARIVVSHAEVKKDLSGNYKFWQQHSTDPVKSMVDAYQCAADKIWDGSDLLFPYCSMLVLYFSIIIDLILLLILISDMINRIEPIT